MPYSVLLTHAFQLTWQYLTSYWRNFDISYNCVLVNRLLIKLYFLSKVIASMFSSLARRYAQQRNRWDQWEGSANGTKTLLKIDSFAAEVRLFVVGQRKGLCATATRNSRERTKLVDLEVQCVVVAPSTDRPKADGVGQRFPAAVTT